MNISFYTEAGSDVGYGHLYRCIAIAKCFLDNGDDVVFYLENEEEKAVLNELLVGVIVRNRREITSLLEKENILLVDISPKSYREFENLHFEKNIVVVGIFDYSLFDLYYSFDFVFKIGLQDYNFRERQIFKDGKLCRLYSGNDFFVFRNEFNVECLNVIKPTVTNILITMGGSDPLNLTLKVVDAMANLDQEVDFDLILGAGYLLERENELRDIINKFKVKVKIHKNVKNIAKIMKNSDLAIINGGNTRYELALLGIPFISIAMNSIQADISKRCEELGVGISLGEYKLLADVDILNSVIDLSKDYNKRLEISRKSSRTIKNSGASNIRNIIKNGN